MLPEQQQRIMGYFIEEAKDHLNTIEQGLLSLQATIEDSEKANEVFRAAHSVKGGAAMLGLESIQTIAHRMEDYFKILKESSVRVDSTLETMFLRVSDGLKDLLEQLEGPFGLTPEKAQEIMADVDPVFGQLEKHLDLLVTADNGTSSGGAALGNATADALQISFRQDISTLLRQLLSTFKQADTPESRRQLQEICTQMSAIGRQFQLSAWCDLTETARLAVEEPNNEYRTLAPILIKEIKKSQDLVLVGRASEVGVSEAMQGLLPEDILATDTLAADDLAPTEALENTADSLENTLDTADVNADSFELDADLFAETAETEEALFVDGLFDAEIDTDTEDIDELFGLDTDSAELLARTQVEASSQLESAYSVGEFGSIQNSLNQAENVESVGLENELEKDSTSRLSIDLNFNEIPSELSALNRNAEVEERTDESLDALLATVNVTGPDVGTEELNSLADLFDGDLEELDNTLGGHPFVSEEMRLHPERIDLSNDEDLTDLLADDSLDQTGSEEDSAAEDEDDLFGGTLTDGGFADIAELDLDDEINNDEIDEVIGEGNSLDTELAALTEDPWAEGDDENDLGDLFGEGANSLPIEPGSPEPKFSTADSLGEQTDYFQPDTDIGELSVAEEEEKLEVADSSTFNGGNREQPVGNLSSGLFAVEPLSPSEQEIEFPTLTGAKLEEAEKDIDSFFFDSPSDSSADFAEDVELSLEIDIEAGEESPQVSTGEEISEDPWSELASEEISLQPDSRDDQGSVDSELSETEQRHLNQLRQCWLVQKMNWTSLLTSTYQRLASK